MTPEQILERKCLNCEYYDRHYGDCHNSKSPRFNPEPDFSCNEFYPDTTNGGGGEK